jgi:subtilase family serine protease
MRALRVVAAAVSGALVVAALWSGAVTVQPDGPARATSFLRLQPAASTYSGAGLTPDDIASAYGLVGGAAGTVAVATAYADPHLEADLAVYRSRFGLPDCTTANGCLTVVAPPKAPSHGESASYIAGWGEETSLDVDAVSAACPDCRILVVQASSDTIDDLGTAVNTAVRLGASAVSASWGDTEWRSWSSTSARYFTHAGVPVVAATGDDGFGAATFPAALPNVIAVGGTTLTSTTTGTSTFRVHEVSGGAVTAATTSATVAADRKALAAAKSALSKANRAVAKAKATLKRARVRLARAASAHDRLHWKHRVRSSTRTLSAARKAARTASKRVSAAESALLKAVLRDSSARAAVAAKRGQTGRASWIETAWDGAGSGCSSIVPRPAWQPGTTCSKRAAADVSADADPQSGIATYDSFGTSKDTPDGWMVAGGTSLAAPLVAAMLVRSGHAAAYSSAEPLYDSADGFWDITAGSNGDCGTALCDSGVGYDGPTGLGTPRSLASF